MEICLYLCKKLTAMKSLAIVDKDYVKWLSEVKHKIQSAQIRTALVANSALIEFYYDLGRVIVEKQAESSWGDKLIQRLSKDLQSEFLGMSGFSYTNLKYCKQFFQYFQISPQPMDEMQLAENKWNEISPQLGDKLALNADSSLKDLVFTTPWGHIKEIISKIKNPQTALYYFSETRKNAWSRDVLALQLKNKIHQRQGKAVTNFSLTLPEPMSDLARQTLKDPYVFDFLTISKPYHEKDIEKQLVEHLAKFLLELGKGFAFVGQQYHLSVADSDYYVDLLFYNIPLKCYVVVELKNTKFIPEYAGKLNFYLSAVDTLLKKDEDKPTIGILLCRDKNNIEAEFALRGMHKPMGVSEFNLTSSLPKKLKSSLPTIEELENQIKKLPS